MVPRDDRPELTSAEFAGAHRVLIVVAAVAVIWLLIECALLLPGLIGRYGWH